MIFHFQLAVREISRASFYYYNFIILHDLKHMCCVMCSVGWIDVFPFHDKNEAVSEMLVHFIIDSCEWSTMRVVQICVLNWLSIIWLENRVWCAKSSNCENKMAFTDASFEWGSCKGWTFEPPKSPFIDWKEYSRHDYTQETIKRLLSRKVPNWPVLSWPIWDAFDLATILIPFTLSTKLFKYIHYIERLWFYWPP